MDSSTRRQGPICVAALMMAMIGWAGCSGGGTAPSGATPPGSAAVVGLTLDVSRVLTGRESPPAAFAVLQGGTSQGVAVTLTSSNPAVISITRTGMLKGEALGTATITASYRGFTAAKAMTVEPDYTGVWSTTYTVTSCADQGAFVTAGWCRQLTAGPMPVSIGLRRIGTDPNVYRSLEGTAVFGSVPCSLTLLVQADGSATGSCFFSLLYSSPSKVEIGDDRVFLYSPVVVPLTLKWDRFSLDGTFSWIAFLSGSSLARQTNQLRPGGSWDPAGTPADATAFPPVADLPQLVDRFRR